MPTGWVQTKLRSGTAIVLVDGIDELPESERGAARTWLRELLTSFPEARYIVSSRPAAVAEAWLDRESFDPAEIQAMTWPDVQALIEQWHQAFKRITTDESVRSYLAEAQRRLLAEIEARRHLRQLTTNPLLTALLCALNVDRRMRLPNDRMEIYKVALDMLLERRDAERQIAAVDFHLSRKDKMLLLEDLAYWLIRNGWSDASIERVTERITQRLCTMPRVDADATSVVKYLLDRSGVIRRRSAV